ncbi:MAG: tetratricopeptide repeat protein [Lachnospiraceae bacterium]|nr:tetratricopeptide repeat protein [Lachnospiraceae bacterium]
MNNPSNPKNDTVIIEPVYPHPMLLHISRLINGDESLLVDSRMFLKQYYEKYNNAENNADGSIDNEILLLQLAYNKNIVSAFFECNKREQWRKRVLIEKAMNLLVSSVAEKYAAIIIESLMFAFGWQFRIDINRKWEVSEEERANFHEKTVFERNMQNDLACRIQIINNNRKIDVSEYMDNETYTGKKPDIKDSSMDNAINSGNSPVTGYNGSKDSSSETLVPGQDSYNDGGQQTAGASRKETALRENSQKENNLLYIQEEEEEDDIPDPVVEYKRMEEAKFYKHMNIRNKRALKKAFQGNASSQCEMGDYYAEKDGGHLDYQEAAKWYSASARKGYERASFELGKLYDQNPPEIEGAKDKAIRVYTKMAEQGFPTAQCILGMKYWFGDGVEVDLNKAIGWLKKAAAQKHDTATRNLADLYAAVSDSENAYRWYKIGAGQGDDYCRKKLKDYE